MTDTASSTTTPTAALSAAGVSIWLDDLSRELLNGGDLQKLIDERNVVGVTTNPTIFASALSKGEAYDEQVRELAGSGADVATAIFEITTADVQRAADVFRPVYDATSGYDGRVSIEHFGASADYQVLYEKFGFTAEAAVAAAKESLAAL